MFILNDELKKKKLPDDLQIVLVRILNAIELLKEKQEQLNAIVSAEVKEEVHKIMSRINFDLVLTLAKECAQYKGVELENIAKQKVKDAMNNATDTPVLPLPITDDFFNFQEAIADNIKQADYPGNEYDISEKDLCFSMTTDNDASEYSVATY